MKKTGIVVALIVVFSFLIGCAHTDGKAGNLSPSPVLDRVQERGKIVIGMAGSMPPLNMTTKSGEIIGLEPDMAKFIAAQMGVKLKIETMPFSELLPALESGTIDMIISNMTITLNRNLKVAFVGPYLKSGKAFLTKIETIARADDATELNDPKIKLAALKDSTSQYFVDAVLPKAKLVTVGHYDEAVDMVIRDEVHALVADYPITLVSVARYPEKGLMSVMTPLTYEPLGIAVPANDPLLINWTGNFLNILQGSGAMEKLNERWFKNTSWLSELP